MNTCHNLRKQMLVLATALAIALLPLAASAQPARIKMPDFSGLAAKAKQSVDIDLDRDLIKTAIGFMAGSQADMDLVEQLKGLQSITVKVFTFDKPGIYSMRDIEGVVKQVETGGWKKLMSVRDGEKNVQMWMREGDENGGLFFVAAEPLNLVMINIAGKVDLATLAKLQGRLGVPNLSLGALPLMAPPSPTAAAPPAMPAPPATPAAPPR